MSLRSVSLIALAAGGMLVYAGRHGQKIADDLDVGAPGSVDVIIQFKTPPAEREHGDVAARGGKLKRELGGLANAAAYTVPANAIEGLAANPNVAAIAPDRVVRSTKKDDIVSYNGAPCDYGYVAVGADTALNTYHLDGSGVGVAVIDSGMDNLTDLLNMSGKKRIVYSESFVPGDASTSDAYGHGNHVAGIIAGTGSNSSGSKYTYLIRGIAPNVNFINLRVLDATGQGTDSSVMAAISRAIQLKNQFNIRVLNLSLGRPVSGACATDALCQAVQQAWQAGITVVVAAGNEGRNNSAGTNGYGTVSVPGNNPYVITVGAMNTLGTPGKSDDKITTYSSKGPSLLDHYAKPDLVAPGNLIFSERTAGSTLDTSYASNRVPLSAYGQSDKKAKDPNYYNLSGTSMAAPMVAGAAALMIQQDATLTPDGIKARLMKTADKIPQIVWTTTDLSTGTTFTDESDIFTVGAGYLNIPAALLNTDNATGSAASPVASIDADGNVTVNFTDPSGASAVWGSAAVWGVASVWGSNTLTDATTAVWATRTRKAAVWGSVALFGSSAGSSTSAIWAARRAAVWGSGAIWGSTVFSEATAILVNGDR